MKMKRKRTNETKTRKKTKAKRREYENDDEHKNKNEKNITTTRPSVPIPNFYMQATEGSRDQFLCKIDNECFIPNRVKLYKRTN